MAVLLSNSDIAEISLSSTLTWERRDLDSDYGSLPANASGVILVFVNLSGNVRQVGAREYNNTNFTDTSDMRTSTRCTAFVKIDSNHEIDIYREHADIKAFLVGYFTTDATWLSTPVDVTPGSTNSWVDIDLSNYTSGGEVFAVFECSPLNYGKGLAVRYNGASLDKRATYSCNHFWAVMGLDGSDIVECNTETTDSTIWLVGFITSGTARTGGGSDLAASLTTGSWADITLPDSGKEIALLQAYGYSLNVAYDVQANGGTGRDTNLYADSYGDGGWPVVAIDGSDLAEVKIETGDIEIYCWGYLEAVSAGSTDVTLNGAAQSLSVTQQTGTVYVEQSATISGAAQSVSLAQLAGAVYLEENATVAGAVQSLALTQPAGAVHIEENITLSGAVQALTMGHLSGTVYIEQDATVAGAVQALAITQPAGAVSISAGVTLSGAVQTLTLAQLAGTPHREENATVSAAAQSLSLAQLAGAVDITSGTTVSGAAQALTMGQLSGAVYIEQDATVAGAVQALTITQPAGAAYVEENATVEGAMLTLAVTMYAGTVDTADVVTIEGALQQLTLTQPAGAVAYDCTLSGAAQALTLAQLTGNATTTTLTGTISTVGITATRPETTITGAGPVVTITAD